MQVQTSERPFRIDPSSEMTGKIQLDEDDPSLFVEYRLFEYGNPIDLRLVEMWIVWRDIALFADYRDRVEQAINKWDRYEDGWYIGVQHQLAIDEDPVSSRVRIIRNASLDE